MLTLTIARQEIVLWHEPGQRSALDELGTVGAFNPQLGGRRLTFTETRDGFRDAQTGSTWNVLGEAVARPLRGRQLKPITHLDTLRFAWLAFQPDTDLHR